MKIARYRQIAEYLREQIVSGTYKPGDKLPTEMELAARYGVSRVTTAAALGELARQGLVRRAPRRGTIVNPFTPRPVARSRPLITWLQPDLDPSFGLDILRGIEYQTRQSGYDLLFRLTGMERADEEQAIRDGVVAGAAAIALFLQDGETYNAEVLRLVLDGFPVVLVDRYLTGVPCASVQSDNVAGAREAVTALLRAGHRHICALVFPAKGTSTIEDRLDGYTEALAHAGVPLDLSLVYVEERCATYAHAPWELPEDVVARFADYLGRRREITAIFASNTFLALLAIRAAARLDLHVPRDLSVISIDPLQALPLAVPAITCMVQQGFRIGMTAVDLLHEQLSGKPPRRVMLPMHMEDHGTIAPPQPRRLTRCSP